MSSLGELFFRVLADTSELESGVSGAFSEVEAQASSAASGATAEMEGAASGIQGALDGITFDSVASAVKDNLLEISAAGAAAGASAEGFARSQSETNSILSRAAIVTGESEGALRDSIVAMSDHTFSSADAARGMEELIRRGIDTKDGFETILPTMDDFSDATGKDMVESIGLFDDVLGALNIPLDEAGDHVDQFTRMTQQTDIPMGTLRRNLARVAPELDTMGFSLDDVAAGIDVFRDRGLTGQEATREFRRAVEESEGDLGVFLDTVGLSEDEWRKYQDGALAAEGLTDQFAEANNATMTPLERVQATLGNVATRFGGFASAAGQAAAPLAALGPAAFGVTQGLGAMSKVKAGLAPVITRVSTAMRGLNVALLANPITIVIAAVAALVAGFVYAFNNIEPFREFILNLWESIQAATERVVGWFTGSAAPAFSGFWQTIQDAAQTVVGWFTGTVAPALQAVWTSVQEGISRLSGVFSTVWNAVRSVTQTVVSWFQSNVGPVISATVDLIVAVWERMQQAWSAAVSALQAVWQSVGAPLVSTLSSAWEVVVTAVSSAFQRVQTAFQSAWTAVRGIWDGVGAPLVQVLTSAWDIVVTAVTAAFQQVQNVIQTVLGVIAGVIRTVTAAIRGDWQGVWQGIQSIVQTVWQGIRTAVQTAIQAVQQIIRSVLSGIQGLWQTTWNAVRALAQTVWTAIRTAITTAINAVRQVISSVLSAIGSLWSSTWNAAQNLAQTVWNGIRTAITTAIEAVRSVITSVLNAVRSLWDSTWNAVRSLAQTVWTAIQTMVSTAIRAVLSIITSTLASISSAWTSAWNSVREFVTTAWNRIQDGVRNGITNLLGIIRRLPQRIIQALGNLGNMLRDAGRRIIQGLANGITDRISSVTESIGDAASAIRDRLPFSPAKEGPLSGDGDPEKRGARLAELIGEGVESVDLARPMDRLLDQLRAEAEMDLTANLSGRGDGMAAREGQGGGERHVHYHVEAHGAFAEPITEKGLTDRLRRIELLHA